MDINSTSSQIGRFFLVIRPFSWRRFVLVADILLLRFWNRTGKIPVLILNEISIPAQYWQQQAPARVFDKSNQHWFWVWDHRLRVFGKTRIKELPIPGIWKHQNQRATTSSGYFKTLKELPGFKKEPEGFWVVIWPFQDFGNRGYISERGICFLGSENRGCEHLEPPWYPAGALVQFLVSAQHWEQPLCPQQAREVHNK